MASDTSNLFSKAEVREIKRFTKGNITFKHYTFYNDDISNLFTTQQNGADTKAPYTVADSVGTTFTKKINPDETIVFYTCNLINPVPPFNIIVPLANAAPDSEIYTDIVPVIRSDSGYVFFSLSGYKQTSLYTMPLSTNFPVGSIAVVNGDMETRTVSPRVYVKTDFR